MASSLRIGVAGPSCSGKSTVARTMAAALGMRHLCLDDRYLHGHERRFVEVGGVAVRSFDHPDAYDGPALLQEAAAMEEGVVAEGFLLFAYPGAGEAFDLMLFIDIPWSEVRRRRGLRTGQTTSKVDASFDVVGEAEWLRFGAPQSGVEGVVALDGRRDAATLATQALDLAARFRRFDRL